MKLITLRMSTDGRWESRRGWGRPPSRARRRLVSTDAGFV